MSMKVISTLAISAFVTLLTACAMQAPIQRPVFPEAEYQRLELSGSGSVSGQVFMRTVGGDVKYGAGSNVFLFPDTTYSEFWYQRSYIEQKALTPPDERQMVYTKVTQADGNGNFKFSNVAPGNYYVSSSVVWQAPTQFGLANQGGIVAKSISVSADNEMRVMLTR